MVFFKVSAHTNKAQVLQIITSDKVLLSLQLQAWSLYFHKNEVLPRYVYSGQSNAHRKKFRNSYFQKNLSISAFVYVIWENVRKYENMKKITFRLMV